MMPAGCAMPQAMAAPAVLLAAASPRGQRQLDEFSAKSVDSNVGGKDPLGKERGEAERQKRVDLMTRGARCPDT